MPGFDGEIAKLAQRVLVNPRHIDWHTGVLATKVTPGKPYAAWHPWALPAQPAGCQCANRHPCIIMLECGSHLGYLHSTVALKAVHVG